MGGIIGVIIGNALEEYFGYEIPENIVNYIIGPFFIILAIVIIFVFTKDHINHHILLKCPHGVRFGLTKKLCEKCNEPSTIIPNSFSDKVDTTEPGKCRCCTSPVKIRYKHQPIPQGINLKYNPEEIKGWKDEYKKVCHLTNYPPQKYFLDLCDNCYKELAIGFVKEVKYGSWLESLCKSLGVFFWIVVIVLIFDLAQLTPKSIFWIVVSYFGSTFYFRYVYDREITTASSKAAIALEELNRESDNILQTLKLIERMDKEAEEARERIRIRNASGIDEIDKMSGIQFEQRLAAYFLHKGYKVQTTVTSGDHGADLIVEMDKRRIAIQAKRYGKQSVGNKAIQEAISGRIMYDCDEAWVITTSTFTKSALELADKAQVKLIDRSQLIRMLGNASAITTS